MRARSTSLIALLPLLGAGCAPVDSSTAHEQPDPLFVDTPRVWPRIHSPTGQVTLISVCWENDRPGDAPWRQAVREAVENTWMREAALLFTGWNLCGSRTADIRIRVSDEHPHARGLGTAIRGQSGGLVLNFDFNNWSTDCRANRDYCIRTIAVHEFGHALGFSHEQNRADTPRAPDLCNDAPQGSDGTRVVGPWDRDSVMNYCNPAWSGFGVLSAGDVWGVQDIYGRKSPGTLQAMSGRCASPLSMNNGADVALWDCVGALSETQQWGWDAANGSLRARATGRALEVWGWGTANGTRASTWDLHGGTNQQWAFRDVHIRGLGGRVVDVDLGTNGVPARTWQELDSPAQRFTFRPDGTIRNANGRCLEAWGWGTANGTPVTSWDCHGGANQQWRVASGGLIVGYGNKCLEISGFNAANGGRLQMWDCHGGLNQRWNLRGSLRGYGDRCLTVHGGLRENGTPINLWECVGQSNQRWDYYP